MVKAPRGGEKAGKSPVDRGKGGIKRSAAAAAAVVDAKGVPLGTIIPASPANRHDSPLLEAATLDTLEPLAELSDRARVHLGTAPTTRPPLTVSWRLVG